MPQQYFPSQLCRPTLTDCNRTTRVWATKFECCAAGSGAFPGGCSIVNIANCYVAGEFYPDSACTHAVNNKTACSR